MDPRTSLWLVELLQELARAGKTIITAAHELEIIKSISKRAIIMGEDLSIRMNGAAIDVLNDFDLLLDANLIHEHMHLHGRLVHEHLRGHGKKHKHENRIETGITS